LIPGMGKRRTRKERGDRRSPPAGGEDGADNPHSFTSLAWQGRLILKMLRGKLTNDDLRARPPLATKEMAGGDLTPPTK
jgi:hypothetical protein